MNVSTMSVFEFTKLCAYGFPYNFSGVKIKEAKA